MERASLVWVTSSAIVLAATVGACGDSGTTVPPDAKCMAHGDGSTIKKDGIGKVTSNVGFGSPSIGALAVRDGDVYVTSQQGPNATFGGLSFQAPPGSYGILAKVKDKAEWLWVLEGLSGSPKIGAWKSGVVAFLTGANMKATADDGTAGPTISPNSTAGLFFADKAKGGKTSFISMPKPDGDAMIEVSAEGAVFVAAKFPDGTDFGTGPLKCGGFSIVRFDAAGQKALWGRCLGVTATSVITVESLTSDGKGEATLTGFPGPSPDFGLGAKAVDASAGGSYVVHLDSLGKTVWVDYTLRSYAHAEATDDGTLFFIGDSPQENANNGLVEYFGATYLPCSGDGFRSIVSRRNPDGKIAWARVFGGQLSMRVLPDKRVVLHHSGQAATLADGAAVTVAGAPAVMVLDPEGKPTSLQTLGDGVTKNTVGLQLYGVAASSSGIWLAGMFDGTLALKSTMTSSNPSDVLINISP